MSTIINTYPVFESSQVLTSSQLNQVVSYLDQQGRLTRTRLIGMGIVCGLELSYDDSGGDLHVTISKGTAVTSEGYLIKLGKCETSWYRPYQLPEVVSYAPFDNTDPSITLFELLREKPEDDTGVVSLEDDPDFLGDKFVLLFLETYDNDIKPCLGNTCDEMGIDRIFTVRKLLISKDDLDELLEHSANVGNLYPHKFELPEIVMPRTLFNPEADHSREFSAFTDHHTTAIQPVFNALFGEKNDDGERAPGTLHQTYSVYDLLLGSEYDLQNPFGTPEMNGLINDFDSYIGNASDSGTTTYGIQYFSDFLKDLILAYNEFRGTAFELVSECCSDMSRFPKHIMLGRAVTEAETPEEAAEYRHGFVQPPIYNHQKYLIEKSISLHKRLLLMVETFSLDRIQNPDPESEDADSLRITPSDEKNTPLSRRSIPWYYDIKKEASSAGNESLEQHWNFDNTRRAGPGGNVTAMSYQNQADDPFTITGPLETPLHYDLDSYPFLRIEGLIGRDHGEVLELLQTLQTTFNLPFDMTALQLDPDADLLIPDYSCGFEDLQEEYRSARSSYCGFTRDIIQLLKYAVENQGPLFGSDDETTEDLKNLGDISKSFHNGCMQLPECLDTFNFADFQQNYKEALQQLLHFILIDKRLLEEIDFNEKEDSEQIQAINGFIQQLSPLLYRFTDMLFYNTFLKLYASFKRREYYLQRETSVFSSYIKKHPGIEHQAGVPKGGTFIVLYNSAEEPAVIGDFALPYLCCGTDHCIPMCDDGDFRVDIPPFARPDFAITTIGRPVEIRMTANDYGMENRTLVVKIEQEETEGGVISLLDEDGTILYKPREEFQGVDRFNYLLSDEESGNSDTGLVTVLVKEEDVERPVGCYPPGVLICWADGDVLKLLEIYLKREPNDPVGDDMQTVANALHQSLRLAGGFTDEELDSTSRLEDQEERRRLLHCIDPDLPTENLEWDELGDRIRQYQEENCGNAIDRPHGECYSIGIIDCWSGGDLDSLVEFYNRRHPNNPITGGSQSVIYNAVLQSLRQSNGFTMSDLRSGILQPLEQRIHLLNCLDIPVGDNVTTRQAEQLILNYQRENCGGGDDREEIPRIELSGNEIAGRELRTVLEARGREMGEDAPLSDLTSEIRRTSPGMRFSKAEVMLFTKDRITNILRDRGLNAPSSANKSELIEILFGE